MIKNVGFSGHEIRRTWIFRNLFNFEVWTQFNIAQLIKFFIQIRKVFCLRIVVNKFSRKKVACTNPEIIIDFLKNYP